MKNERVIQFKKKNNLNKFKIEGWYFDLKLLYLKWVVLIQTKKYIFRGWKL